MNFPAIVRWCRVGMAALAVALRVAWAVALRVALGAALHGLAGAAALPAEHITLAVWGSPPAEARALDLTIAAFTRHTGIVVKKETIADKYMDVLRSRFAARKTPDVFYLDSSEAPMLIQSGVLEAFDGRNTDVPDLADFYPHFIDAFRGDDRRIYGLPKDYSTLALYVNTRLLAAAGFKPDQVPTDFDALMAFCRVLQMRLPKGKAAMIYEKDLARHLSAFESFGTPVITPQGDASLAANPAALAYLEAFVQARRGGYVVSPKDDLGADSPAAAFGAEKTVMMMEGNWVLSALRKDYADLPFVTREMPRVNGRPQTMAFVVGLAVSRHARNKAGAFKFTQFMTQRAHAIATAANATAATATAATAAATATATAAAANTTDWARLSGTLPTRVSVLAALNLAADPALAAHITGAGYATVWSRGIGLPIVNTNFGNQFLAALNGSKSVLAAMQRAEQAANRELERQR